MGNKTNSGVSVDRITSLHESVLSNILSRLSTKEVVRTSVLSKDWKYKWVSMDSVDTDLESWDTGRRSSFADFLDKILISRQHLRRFRTSFECPLMSMTERVQKWLNAALRHNLEYLDINIHGIELTVPAGLLNSTSLREINVMQADVVLTLVTVNVGEKNCAPNLTRLCLHSMEFVNQNLDSSTVSFDFPVLEVLEFRDITFSYDHWKNVKRVEINAPSLTTFTFEPSLLYGVSGLDSSIKIIAPKLTRFLCFDGLPGNVILDWSSIVFASLIAEDDPRMIGACGLQAINLVNGFINLEELTLSNCMTEVLWNGPPLQHHDKLKRLTLCNGCDADQLFKLLHAMPLLKFLSMNVDYLQDFDYEAMEITPSCIASSLQEVVLHTNIEDVPQYKLAKFLLNSAKKLKKFTMTSSEDELSEEMKKVLSLFSDCSPSLQICLLLKYRTYLYERRSSRLISSLLCS